jgi:hypothetical protein
LLLPRDLSPQSYSYSNSSSISLSSTRKYQRSSTRSGWEEVSVSVRPRTKTIVGETRKRLLLPRDLPPQSSSNSSSSSISLVRRGNIKDQAPAAAGKKCQCECQFGLKRKRLLEKRGRDASFLAVVPLTLTLALALTLTPTLLPQLGLVSDPSKKEGGAAGNWKPESNALARRKNQTSAQRSRKTLSLHQ